MADDSGGKLQESDIKPDSSHNDLSAHQNLAAEQCHAHGQGQGQGYGQSQLTTLDGPKDKDVAMADTSIKNTGDFSVGTVDTGKARDLLDTDDTSSKGRHSSGTSSEGRSATGAAQPGAPKKQKTAEEIAADAAKQKEKEERLKHAKARAKHEREKKIIDLQEAQRKAEEYRRKQEEDRRRKLDEIKRKEESHRTMVEERRRRLLQEDTTRKQEIIRRSVERDAKLDSMKSRRSTGGLYAFGSRTVLPTGGLSPQRAISQGNLHLKPSPGPQGAEPPHHSMLARSPNRAVSACNLAAPSHGGATHHKHSVLHAPLSTDKKAYSSVDLNSSRTRPTSGGGSSPRASANRPPPHKRLSASTSHLGGPKRPPKPVNKSEADLSASVDDLGSVSPGPKLRSKSADYRRSRADIQRTFERLSTPRSKPKDPSLDTSRSTKSTPTPPRPMAPRTLPKDSSVTKPTAASAQKGVTPTKGPVKAVHIKFDNQNDQPKTPLGKESSPLRERGRSREGSATRDKPARDKAVPKDKHTPTEKAPPKEKPAHKERAPPKEKPAPEKAPPKEKPAPKERIPLKEKPASKESKPKTQAAKPTPKAPTPTSEKPATKVAAISKNTTPAKDKKEKPSKDAISSKPAAAKAPKAEPKPKTAAEEVVVKDKAPTTDAAAKKVEPKVDENKEEKKMSPGTSPAVTPATGEKEAKKEMSEEDEYRAKLAERRRLAREKAEREAEEERKRQEELRREEEERRRREEEEERRQMEEAIRLAEEQRRAEEERLQRAIEAEEARKREEQKRLEEERIAKEEAERKAAEEAERREVERQERMKKEEEERQARKKRLEMIMKRVKTDDGSPKAQSPGSPSKSIVTPPKETSPSEETAPAPVQQVAAPSPPPFEEDAKSSSPEDAATPVATSPSEEVAPSPIAPTASITPQKAAPPLDDTPKFKSPLLQQMLGKNRARPTTIDPKMESNEEPKTVTETARNLVEDVVSKAAETLQESVAEQKMEDSSVSVTAEPVSAKELESPVDEDKDIDTSRDLLNNEEPAGSSLDTTSSSSTPSQIVNADTSGLVNGYDNVKDVEMEESNQVDSPPHVNGTSEGPKTTSGADHFEELIDLSAVDNKNVHAAPGGDSSTVSKYDADLINSNATTTTEKQAPLIAFEESTLKDNIQDMLS